MYLCSLVDENLVLVPDFGRYAQIDLFSVFSHLTNRYTVLVLTF